jgi:hypothetical protein
MIRFLFLKPTLEPYVVMHTGKSSTREAKVRGMSLSPDWAI